MLPAQEIKKRSLSQRHNRFVFVTSPHPMLLWVTLLYNPELTPRWLPCYLDMQNLHNRQIVSSLAENERYPLVCFSLEAPHRCINVISSYIDPSQRQKLKIWVEQSQKLPSTSQLHLSKNLLKQQYKQIQSQMLQQAAAPQAVASASLKR